MGAVATEVYRTPCEVTTALFGLRVGDRITLPVDLGNYPGAFATVFDRSGQYEIFSVGVSEKEFPGEKAIISSIDVTFGNVTRRVELVTDAYGGSPALGLLKQVEDLPEYRGRVLLPCGSVRESI